MKILILANSSLVIYNFRIELVEKLSENNKVVLSYPITENDEKHKKILNRNVEHIPIKIDRRGNNTFKDFILLIRYILILIRINPDKVVTYTIKPNIYGGIASLILRKKLIINITGIGTGLVASKYKILIIFLYRIACMNAEKVFFQNQSNLNFFIENKIVKKEKCELIPGSGVNIEIFSYHEVKEEKKIRFLYIGRIMREKGIQEYLQVANIIKEKYNNVEFDIIGSFEEKEYEKIIDGNSNVNYFGVVEDVKSKIINSTCIINPSYHEGMSNVLLEAGAIGRPLIASNIPGCREIIKEDYNGFLFECKNTREIAFKIEKFLEKSMDEIRLMGLNSRRKVSLEFDRRDIISKITAYIEDKKMYK